MFIVIIFIRDHQRLAQTLLRSFSLTLLSIIFFSKHWTNWIPLPCLASVWRWTFLFAFFPHFCPLIELLTFSHLNHQLQVAYLEVVVNCTELHNDFFLTQSQQLNLNERIVCSQIHKHTLKERRKEKKRD